MHEALQPQVSLGEKIIFSAKDEIHGRLGSVHAMNFGRNQDFWGVRVIRMP
jgi:hypothetical protein